ncbi:MAG: DUF1501 domain-containing protein [Acidobacteria bacterium]|nr:DUF1501 domain-containing protein [Acidobacteriota bacterium]
MKTTRRRFIRQTLNTALGTACAHGMLGDLQRTLAATSQANDFKALVCIYLSGGNDGDNMLVARGFDEYRNYAIGRDRLAVGRQALLPITPATSDGREWGLHPSLTELQPLFAQKKLAILANTGLLNAPLTREQYLAGSSATPRLLFSHTDQMNYWHTSLPDRHDARTGWGGRLADALRALNANARLSLSVSISGNNLFQSAEQVIPYQISPEGSVGLLDYFEGSNPDMREVAVREILALEPNNLFERAYRDLTKRAIENNLKLKTALGVTPPPVTYFPETDLGAQLKMIARLLSVREPLGIKRQIFYCAIDGFDTHGAQYETHATLLREVSQSLAAFYQATVELGIADKVTTFTTSEFGRTWHSTGLGSDHGWGNHHLILGGAVKGGDLYGKMPVQVEEGPDDSTSGRWIPTTSVDEYAATLARWFGVSATEMPLVVPNIGRFAKPNLGFMG